ncbi:hypothetical protein IWZ01DRAFT_145710 [Phyllosticta capitalensis]
MMGRLRRLSPSVHLWTPADKIGGYLKASGLVDAPTLPSLPSDFHRRLSSFPSSISCSNRRRNRHQHSLARHSLAPKSQSQSWKRKRKRAQVRQGSRRKSVGGKMTPSRGEPGKERDSISRGHASSGGAGPMGRPPVAPVSCRSTSCVNRSLRLNLQPPTSFALRGGLRLAPLPPLPFPNHVNWDWASRVSSVSIPRKGGPSVAVHCV